MKFTATSVSELTGPESIEVGSTSARDGLRSASKALIVEVGVRGYIPLSVGDFLVQRLGLADA